MLSGSLLTTKLDVNFSILTTLSEKDKRASAYFYNNITRKMIGSIEIDIDEKKLHIHTMENTSGIKHVGKALHEFAFRLSLALGKGGNVSLYTVNSTSDGFHFAEGFRIRNEKDNVFFSRDEQERYATLYDVINMYIFGNEEQKTAASHTLENALIKKDPSARKELKLSTSFEAKEKSAIKSLQKKGIIKPTLDQFVRNYFYQSHNAILMNKFLKAKESGRKAIFGYSLFLVLPEDEIQNKKELFSKNGNLQHIDDFLIQPPQKIKQCLPPEIKVNTTSVAKQGVFAIQSTEQDQKEDLYQQKLLMLKNAESELDKEKEKLISLNQEEKKLSEFTDEFVLPEDIDTLQQQCAQLIESEVLLKQQWEGNEKLLTEVNSIYCSSLIYLDESKDRYEKAGFLQNGKFKSDYNQRLEEHISARKAKQSSEDILKLVVNELKENQNKQKEIKERIEILQKNLLYKDALANLNKQRLKINEMEKTILAMREEIKVMIGNPTKGFRK